MTEKEYVLVTDLQLLRAALRVMEFVTVKRGLQIMQFLSSEIRIAEEEIRKIRK